MSARPMPPEAVSNLIGMGYTKEQAEEALRVTEGDVNQAVEYLCLGESRAGFLVESSSLSNNNNNNTNPRSNSGSINSRGSLTMSQLGGPIHENSTTNNTDPNIPHRDLQHLHGTLNDYEHTTPDSALAQLVSMGYTASMAKQALSVSDGNIDQAIGFLCMGDGSRNEFVVDGDTSLEFRPPPTPAAIQHERLDHYSQQQQQQNQQQYATPFRGGGGGGGAPPPNNYNNYNHHHPHHGQGQLQQNSATPPPRMVATESSLDQVKDALRASVCVALIGASRFLIGRGVVDASYLDSMIIDGVSIYRLFQNSTHSLGTDEDLPTVEEALAHPKATEYFTVTTHAHEFQYGEHKIVTPSEPYRPHDPKGLRRLLAACRNEIQEGPQWLAVIVEWKPHPLQTDHVVICLPPKGSSNQFWILDPKVRTSFRVPGAYARIHATMEQMVVSLERIVTASVTASPLTRTEDPVPFIMYPLHTV